MPGQPVQIGPFVGGLNNVSTSGEARDNEVVELVNLEVGLDTSLTSRPPIEAISGTFVSQPNGWEVLGIYRLTSSSWYLIVEKPTGATTWDILAYPQGDFTATPVAIKTVTGVNNKIVKMVQYNDYVYFNVATGASDTGGRWKTGGSYSAISTMPRGTAMVVWKDRIWITGSGTSADGNYIWFSTVDSTGPKPDTYNTSTDFINVSPGQGGMNTALLALSGALLIFKEDATFRFSFPSKPASGIIETLGFNIGCATANSVVGFDNYCFVYDQGRVYEVQNQQFNQINLNVKFQTADNSPDATAPGIDMSVVNRRIVIRYLNTIYAYAVDTKTWSQWQVIAGTPGKFFEIPTDSASASPSSYIAASEGTTQLAGDNRIVDPAFEDTDLNIKRTAGGTKAVISGTTVTLTADGIVHLNATGKNSYLSSSTIDSEDYNIPVGPGQQFTFTATGATTAVSTNQGKLTFSFLRKDGTVTSTTIDLVAADFPNISKSTTVPDNAILMAVSVGTGTSQTAASTTSYTSPNITRSSGASSPVGLLKLTEAYSNAPALEFIECWVKTKSYDYQANSVFKRLFLWGADIKTPRPIEAYAYPLGRQNLPTWDDLENYTWDQLEAGTWDNPLSWLGSNKSVIDDVEAQVDISDNGRYFLKLGQSMRFRQIQYAIRMTTLGNAETGPVKLFSLTTYTAARQLVVDKAT